MKLELSNLFDDLPVTLKDEHIDTIVSSKGIRIERIVSHGHCSDPDFWYDQEESEWLTLLAGEAIISFEESGDIHLIQGSTLNIPAHCRHQVKWTHPSKQTIWLAVHYSSDKE